MPPAGPDAERVRRLASQFRLPIIDEAAAGGAPLILTLREGALTLLDRSGERPRTLSIDFRRLDLRPGSPGLSRRQPLGRALGTGNRIVADATAGLAHDSMLLAALGCEVLAIERCPAVAALVQDALERAAADPILGPRSAHIRLLCGDAREVLPHLDPPPQVVYVDPMFPPRRKRSALPRQDLLILRELAGDGDDGPELVDVALRVATRRVVVKRPLSAPPLRPDPAHSHAGKLARYDVYVAHRPT